MSGNCYVLPYSRVFDMEFHETIVDLAKGVLPVAELVLGHHVLRLGHHALKLGHRRYFQILGRLWR